MFHTDIVFIIFQRYTYSSRGLKSIEHSKPTIRCRRPTSICTYTTRVESESEWYNWNGRCLLDYISRHHLLCTGEITNYYRIISPNLSLRVMRGILRCFCIPSDLLHSFQAWQPHQMTRDLLSLVRAPQNLLFFRSPSSERRNRKFQHSPSGQAPL